VDDKKKRLLCLDALIRKRFDVKDEVLRIRPKGSTRYVSLSEEVLTKHIVKNNWIQRDKITELYPCTNDEIVDLVSEWCENLLAAHKEKKRERSKNDDFKFYVLLDVFSDKKNNYMFQVGAGGKLLNRSFSSTSELYTKEEQEYIQKIPARKTYDPYREKTVSEYLNEYGNPEYVNSKKVYSLNTYIPPTWVQEKPLPFLHPSLKKFLDLFFDEDKEALEYFLQMTYICLFKERLQVFMIMNGATGSGKSLLAEFIMLAAGATNGRRIPGSWKTSHFNGFLDRLQIGVFDEISLTERDHLNYLKSLANDTISIEEKGKEPTFVNNSASFFITNNNRGVNIKLEEDSRRFSFLDCTDIKLEHAMPNEEERLELVKILKFEHQDSGRFFAWLKERYDGKTLQYDAFSLYIGKKYKENLYNSKTYWQRAIWDMMSKPTEPTFIYEDLKDTCSKDKYKYKGMRFSQVARQTVINFVADVRYWDGMPLGTCKEVSIEGVETLLFTPHQRFFNEESIL